MSTKIKFKLASPRNITFNVESDTYDVETLTGYTQEEWDELSDYEREQELEEGLQQFLSDNVDSWWEIENDDSNS